MKRTTLEIEEGKIYKRYFLNPTDTEARRAAWNAWEDLVDTQGLPTPARCDLCKVVRTERPFEAPCDVCGYQREVGEHG